MHTVDNNAALRLVVRATPQYQVPGAHGGHSLTRCVTPLSPFVDSPSQSVGIRLAVTTDTRIPLRSEGLHHPAGTPILCPESPWTSDCDSSPSQSRSALSRPDIVIRGWNPRARATNKTDFEMKTQDFSVGASLIWAAALLPVAFSRLLPSDQSRQNRLWLPSRRCSRAMALSAFLRWPRH